jgi:hypothetical protein
MSSSGGIPDLRDGSGMGGNGKDSSMSVGINNRNKNEIGAWDSCPKKEAAEEATGCDEIEEEFFPYNEANFINKPYLSSVAQCHYTDYGCEKIRNVRWREPISDIFTYDLDPPPYPPFNFTPDIA